MASSWNADTKMMDCVQTDDSLQYYEKTVFMVKRSHNSDMYYLPNTKP